MVCTGAVLQTVRDGSGHPPTEVGGYPDIIPRMDSQASRRPHWPLR